MSGTADPAAPAASSAAAAPVVASGQPPAGAGVTPAVAATAQPAPVAPKVEGNVLGDGLTPEAPKEPEAPAEPIDPASYLETLKLPDGIAKDDPLLTAFLGGAAKGGMDGESVQAVVEAMGPEITKALSAPYEAWKAMQEEWQGAVKTDPLIGGDKTPAVVATINRALAQVSGDDLAAVKQALEITGAGNNPAIIRAFFRLSQGLVERSGPVTGTPTDPRPARNAALASMYPSAAKAAEG